ncbi:TolC family protein [Aquabacterium sp. J223]|uniref:TolC family protein n=1 Tax=Aquabacterium sp. J223 TaxID=2898431 RepID=UPI0021ADA5DB|nr:TolC family protein [Aquabacterium sp. J223]UUX94252.1 TolC family protein [Aquabacterium sp. J223]
MAVLFTASVCTAVEPPPLPPVRASEQTAPGWAWLLDRAWTRQRRDEAQAARGAVLQARGQALATPFAGPPTVGLDVRRDLPPGARLPGTDTVGQRGRNELEPGVSVPLWLPGQREAGRATLTEEEAARTAAATAGRWRLAGELREAAAALALADARWQAERAREAGAAALEDDVRRRVQAGDLAPADALLAAEERLAAAMAAREAHGLAQSARARWLALTGWSGPLPPAEVPLPPLPDDDHPALAEARAAVGVAQARAREAALLRRDAPTLSMAARFDREGYGTGYRNTVRVGIALPLDTEARNAPRLAAAEAERLDAELALQAVRRQRQLEREQALAERQAADDALALAAERLAVAGRLDAAVDRAWRAGERGLPERLRVRALAREAEWAHENARRQADRAAARWNQAIGAMP